jgi:hypothetical protein
LLNAQAAEMRKSDIADSAEARFAAISVSEKMRLARKAVGLYASTLMRKHKELLNVTAGYKVRRGPEGQATVYPEPSVIFVVTSKWTTHETRKLDDELPKYLSVRAVSEGVRGEFAVPTDVQPCQWIEKGLAQEGSGIEIQDHAGSDGSIACAVEVKTLTESSWYALSALHVLTPFPELDGSPEGELEVNESVNQRHIGLSTGWAGMLRSEGPSFDVQLAEIDREWLNKQFPDKGLDENFYLRSSSEFDQIAQFSKFLVLVPTRRPRTNPAPVIGQFYCYGNENSLISYKVRIDGITYPYEIRHEEIIILAAEEGASVSEYGDSGSGVVGIRAGKIVFVGMLIAGSPPESKENKMYVLPAWHIFNRRKWATLPKGVMKITPAFSIPAT